MFQFSGSSPISNIGTGIGNNRKYRSAMTYAAILVPLLFRVGKNICGSVGTINTAKEIDYVLNHNETCKSLDIELHCYQIALL